MLQACYITFLNNNGDQMRFITDGIKIKSLLQRQKNNNNKTWYQLVYNSNGYQKYNYFYITLHHIFECVLDSMAQDNPCDFMIYEELLTLSQIEAKMVCPCHHYRARFYWLAK